MALTVFLLIKPNWYWKSTN